MTVNVVGIISLVVFYLLILAVGIWAGRKQKNSDSSEDAMLAGRNVGMLVGIFSMTATWVDGGYINGTSEVLFTKGLVWCQGPIGYSISLVFGGLLFATKMREKGYVTMLDPFQVQYGNRMGGLLFIPALCGEIFWSAAILAALGATVSVIVELDTRISIVASGCIAVIYTIVGGMYSVTYTDVIELICIFVGLWLCIPFCLTHRSVGSLKNVEWFGRVEGKLLGQYIDNCFLLVFGGIPWQVYFQRVLSCKTAFQAKILSYIAGIGCIIMAIPPAVIGLVAKVTVWNETAYHGPLPLDEQQSTLILPLVLQYLTPVWVSFIGLGAVSAAVMSSSDASILSASSMFARNIYKLIFRFNASERELLWVMRIAMVIAGTAATVMALQVHSIYSLWYLCGDLVFVILFPQLLGVVYFPKYCNTYGSLAAYITGFFLRLSGGEKLLFIPPLIRFPYYNHEDGQLFPFKTMTMVISFFVLFAISEATRRIFVSGFLPEKRDVFRCVVNFPKVQTISSQQLNMENVSKES